MKITTKFNDFTNEGIKSTGNKVKRIVTGKSAGEEINKLSESQQRKLIELYGKDPMEAARFLRSIIIKEKNSQFGLGLALTIAGSGMIWKAYNMQDPPPPPPPPPPKPEVVEYIVKAGDSWWKIAENNLPDGASNKDIMAYAKEIASANDAEHLYSGKYGSPGLKADTWYDFSNKEVSTKVIDDADRLVPGEKIVIPKYSGSPTIVDYTPSTTGGSGGGSAVTKDTGGFDYLEPKKAPMPETTPDRIEPIRRGISDSITRPSPASQVELPNLKLQRK